MEIKNLQKTARRILKAIKLKEKIIIYSDADLDGVSSAIILKESIQNLGGKISVLYFPDREKEGYGLNKKALRYLKEKAPALLLLLDCGIGNFEEIELAEKMGFEVAVIEHHEMLEKIPKASIIVNPKQKGDKYPFKFLATAGIVFRLSKALFGKKISRALENSFLELVALATVADMMPREKDNLILVEMGLRSLENSFRPGIKVFFEIEEIKNLENQSQKVQRIVSALNISNIKDHLNETYLLLSSPDVAAAGKTAEELLEKSNQRQIRIKEITQEIEQRILNKVEQMLVFEGDAEWPLVFLGAVASRICRSYKKPVFLFRKDKTKSQGAVRIPAGLDGVKAMASCSSLLETYGGHPPAAGFRIKNKNLEKFRECLTDYFINHAN